jgi:hypothetical protein
MNMTYLLVFSGEVEEMVYKVELKDNFFTADELADFKELFNITNEVELAGTIQQITMAAWDEYKDMLLGRGLPSRVDEIRQHRLFYLIKHYFKNRIPTEAEVSRMFQLPESRSRNLILYVMTTFRYELDDIIGQSLESALMGAVYNEDEEKYWAVIQSKNVVDEFNSMLAKEAPRLETVKSVKNMSRTYAISVDTYKRLWELCGGQTLKNALMGADFNEDEGKYWAVIHSKHVVEEFNSKLAKEVPRVEMVKPVKNKTRTYAINVEAYKKLRELCGLTEKVELPVAE